MDAGNSGTAARLLCSLLIDSNYKIKIVGDKSLQKRDMTRVIKPLKMFGANFKNGERKLPIFIKGSKYLNPINYTENLGSAQCKSAIMIAADVMRMSTMFYGNEFDLEQFKAMLKN